MKKVLLGLALVLCFLGTFAKKKDVEKWLENKKILFVENKGQIRDLKGRSTSEVLYFTELQGVSVFFQKARVSYVFPRYEKVKEQNSLAELYRIDLELVGANQEAILLSDIPSSDKLNYYIGTQSIEAVNAYQKITYKNIYKNIDLVFYAQQGRLKYDFIVRPGGNPKDIQLRYTTGNQNFKPQINKAGDLELQHPLGKLQDEAPITFQHNKAISSRYRIDNQTGIVDFELGRYDSTQTLTIDPLTRQWATFYGGNRRDRALGITEDAAGNITIVGFTLSGGSPVFPGVGSNPIPFGGQTDAFITQFDANGNRLWATYFGGSGIDQGNSIATDLSGNVYIVGSTTSNNLAGASNSLKGQTDAFIASFTPSGLWRWSQYYGSNDRDWAGSIVAAGNMLYVSGFTTGVGLPTVNATQTNYGGGGSDAFVAAFTTTGNLALSTYFGGVGAEQAWGITVTSRGLFIAGLVDGANLPGAQNFPAGKRDAFIAAWKDGQQDWVRYFGGAEDDDALAITSDYAGNLYFTGSTKSSNLPVLNAFDPTKNGSILSEDIYVASLAPEGILRWSTYYGGANIDKPTSIAIAPGRVYVVGSTNSTDFPLFSNLGDYSQPLGGFYDAFLVGLDYEGQRKQSIVYGSLFMDQANAVSANSKGNIRIAGYTNSQNFPTQNAWQAAYGGEEDAFFVSFQGDSPCQTTNLRIAATSTANRCAGDNTGSVNVVVTGGQLPYAYLWSGPNNFTASSDAINNLAAGEYSVVVTDRNGCSAQTSVSVLQPERITLSLSSTNLLCNGAATGTIDLNISGGVGGYVFSWEGPNGFSATTQNLQGLRAGNYQLTVTDGNQCRAQQQVVLTEPAAIALEDVVSENVTCFGGQNGKITISVTGGNAPYSFSWSGPNNFRSNAQNLDALVAGDYQGKITDANGCQTTGLVTITQPQPLVITADSIAPVSCSGRTDGAIFITVTGGTEPYTYFWRKEPRFVDNTQDITELAGGQYTVAVTDSKGCAANASFTVSENPPLELALLSVTSITCAGDANGEIDIAVSGGTAPYSFNWQGPEGFQASIEDIANLKPGDYQIIVQDARNCLARAQYNVPSPQPLAITAESISNVTCNGANNGSLTITVSGGTAPYRNYSWSGPNNFTSTNKDLTRLAAGQYTANVTDANGCVAQAIFTIAQPLPLALEFSKTDISCNGRKDGRISVTVAGGTEPYTYLWNGPDVNPAAQNLQINLGAGEYTLEVTDANNCVTLRRQIPIVEPAPLRATVQATRVTCRGGNDGKIDFNVTGGTEPYSYAWTLPGGQTINSKDLDSLSAGNYAYSVVDARNCFLAPGIATIEEGTLLTVRAVSDDATTFCADKSAVLVAVASEPNVSYQWEKNGALIEDANQERLTVNTAGEYKVRVQNREGCLTQSDVIVIGVNALPAVRITNPINELTICEGGSVTLAAAAPTATNFSWIFRNEVVGTQPQFVATIGGVYEVRITDNNGCQNNAFATLTVNSLPIARIRPLISNVLCAPGDTLILEAETDKGVRFVWRQNGVAQTSSGLFFRMLANDLTVNTSYNITVEAIDSNGCSRTSEVQVVQVAPKPNAVLNLSGPQRFCSNQLQALSVAAGAAGTTYQWFRNETPIAGATANTYLPRSNGEYKAQVVSPAGCRVVSNIIPVTIFRAPFLNLTSSGPLTYCSSQRPTILIIDNGADSLTWFRNGQVVLTNNRALTADTQGEYKAQAYDRVTGCKSDTTVRVRIIPAIQANAGPDKTICQGETTTLEGASTGGNGQDGNIYSWAPALGLSNPNIARPIANPGATTTYTLSVTDSTGACLAVDLVTVTVNSLPNASIIAEEGRTVICQDGFARLLVTNPAPNNIYQWLKNNQEIAGAASSEFLATELGIFKYSARIKNNITGCSNVSNEIEVTVHPKPNVQVVGGKNFCLGDSITLSAPENSGWRYQWYRNAPPIAGQTLPVLKVKNSGAYWVQVTNEFGCKENSDTSGVTVFPIPVANAGPDASVCSNQTIKLGAPAINGINYSWAPAERLSDATVAEPIFTPLQSGLARFILTVEANGCSSSDTVAVTVSPAPVVRIEHATPLAFCQKGRVRLSSNITGSSYLWQLNGNTVGVSSAYTATEGGVYRLTVGAQNGCSASDSVTVTVYQAPVAVVRATVTDPAAFTTDSTYCGALPLTLSAFDNSHLDGGGNSRVEYQWQFNGASQANAQQAALSGITQSGNYSVIITDTVSGCVAISRVYTVQQKQKANAGPDITVCVGANANLQTSTSGSAYLWRPLTSNAPTLSDNALANPSFNAGLVPGTYAYELTVITNTFCQPEKDTVQVTVKPNPSLVVTKVSPSGCTQDGRLNIEVNNADLPLNYFLLDAGTNVLQQKTGATNLVESFELLRAGVYRVRVVDSNGCATLGGSDTLLIAAPQNLGLFDYVGRRNPDSTSIALRWNAVAGADVTYNVRYRQPGETDWTLYDEGNPTNSLDVAQLQQATTYEFQVQAVCSNNDRSAWSSIFSATTDIFRPASCDTVRNLRAAIDVENSAATISWVAPPVAWDGAAPACYRVQLFENGAPKGGVRTTANTTLEIPFLETGRNYTVRVQTNCNNCAQPESQSAIHSVNFNLPPAKLPGSTQKQGMLFELYPNPSSGVFNITFRADSQEPITVDVLELSGRVLYTRTYMAQLGENQLTVALSEYTSGMYLVQLRQNGKVSTAKIMMN
jgi:hypothetical protein